MGGSGVSAEREKRGCGVEKGIEGVGDMPTYVYHPLSTERAKRCVNQNRLKRMYPSDRRVKKKKIK